jgi:uncharacterized protein (TIGR03435 family)
MRPRHVVTIGIVWAVSTAALLAQQPAVPRFDVVSIKPNKSVDVAGSFRATPAGRFEWTNMTVGTIISVAYQRFAFDQTEVVGAPEWADRERFDVIVQTGNGPPPMDATGFPAVLTAMLRNMLADRFQLTAHFEKRERPVYLLQLARPRRWVGEGVVTRRGAVRCRNRRPHRRATEHRAPGSWAGLQLRRSARSAAGECRDA